VITWLAWPIAVENFFSEMARQRIRRGIFRLIADLQAAINAYLAKQNASPKPFVWTKSATLFSPNSTASLYHLFDPLH
jgi:hypothetical protein